ncbi:hypothetical protein Leryth_022255 [Lithospermum erythrorhizon]|nr:hypothetical protein Leryth_022255 [Lithospermum erythrorhizon]
MDSLNFDYLKSQIVRSTRQSSLLTLSFHTKADMLRGCPLEQYLQSVSSANLQQLCDVASLIRILNNFRHD